MHVVSFAIYYFSLLIQTFSVLTLLVLQRMLCRRRGAKDLFRIPLRWEGRCRQVRGGRTVLPLRAWKKLRTALKKLGRMKKMLLTSPFSALHPLSPFPVLQASTDAVRIRMHPTTPAGPNAAPYRGVAQRPIGCRGISMQSLSGFHSIRRECRGTGMQRSETERDTLGIWMRLKPGQGSRSCERVASLPAFDPLPRGQTRVFHLFFPLSISRHLLPLFPEFNHPRSPPPNLSRSLKHSSQFRGEGRQRVQRQWTERIRSKASTCLPFGMLWKGRSVSEASRVWGRSFCLKLLPSLKRMSRLFPPIPSFPLHLPPRQQNQHQDHR
jgi:hypothetical protein